LLKSPEKVVIPNPGDFAGVRNLHFLWHRHANADPSPAEGGLGMTSKNNFLMS
jgi:hypothetical protein